VIVTIGCIVGWYLKDRVISGEEGRDSKTYVGKEIRSIYSAI